MLCPKVTGPWERYQGLLGLFIGIAFFVLCVWLGLFVLTRVAGGTLTGGAARFVSLAIWSITTIQVGDALHPMRCLGALRFPPRSVTGCFAGVAR